ncbi:MAG: toll/interleukin-1 receptor domain-containing protein [Rhodomicrobium sp.]
MPGRIFISYSKADPQPTQELADFLTSQGYHVWWDTNLTAGEVFREVIDRELDAADAVIVIWTANSVASNWVIAEAEHGARRNRLITLRTADLQPWRIPKPYNTYQADVVDNHDAILAAVKRVACIARGDSTITVDRQPKNTGSKPEYSVAFKLILGFIALYFFCLGGVSLIVGLIHSEADLGVIGLVMFVIGASLGYHIYNDR